MINIPEKLQFLLGLKLIGLLEPLGRGDILIEDIRVFKTLKVGTASVTSEPRGFRQQRSTR